MEKNMPRKPKKPCSYPGCPELIEDGSYCKKHQRDVNRYYEKYRIDPLTKKRYGSKWRKIRNRYINNNPLCEECLKDGRFTKAEEVHHILPLRRGGNHDESNLMALCKSCHSKISILVGVMGTQWGKRTQKLGFKEGINENLLKAEIFVLTY